MAELKQNIVAGDWDFETDWFTQKPLNDHYNDGVPSDPEVVENYKYGSITYRHNSMGFRGREFTGKKAIFGDSFVYGVGVEHPFAELLSMDNCGSGGASNDLITRNAMNYIYYFKPALIIVCWTYCSRREWVGEGRIHNLNFFHKIFRPADSKKLTDIEFAWAEITNIGYDYYTWYKNKLLLELLCEKYNIRLIEINNHSLWREKNIPYALKPYPTDTDLGGWALDGSHPGQPWHNEMAKLIEEKLKKDA